MELILLTLNLRNLFKLAFELSQIWENIQKYEIIYLLEILSSPGSWEIQKRMNVLINKMDFETIKVLTSFSDL
jgi:hypothetical protein